MPTIRKIAPPPPVVRPLRIRRRLQSPTLNAAGILRDGERSFHIDRAPRHWLAWLAKHDRLRVQVWSGGRLHSLTARIKRVKGHPYWYVEKKVDSITHCRYLGKAELLSWGRISIAATKLIATSNEIKTEETKDERRKTKA